MTAEADCKRIAIKQEERKTIGSMSFVNVYDVVDFVVRKK